MRGVEAPFQLMVSVIALLAVIALSYLVLSNATQEDCLNKWENELRKVAAVMATVIDGSAPTKMSVKYDFRCGAAQTYTLKVVSTDEETKCLRVCGTTGGSGCTFLLLEATKNVEGRKEAVGQVSVCVEGVSSFVRWGENENCEDGENVTRELLNDGLELDPPFGVFQIKKVFGMGEPVAICEVV